MNEDIVLEETVVCTGETKNCYVFEPDEGMELVSKLYIRKSVFAGKPMSVTIMVSAND